MNLFQILKGWLFIVFGAIALYLMALAMEHRHGHLVKPPGEVKAPPAEQPTNTGDDGPIVETSDLPESAPTGREETTTDPNLTEKTSAPPETETGPPASNQVDQPPIDQHQTTADRPEVGEPAAMTQPAQNPSGRVILPEATSFTEAEADQGMAHEGTPVMTSEAASQDPGPMAPTALNCMLVMAPDGEMRRASLYDPDRQMLIWEDLAGLQVHALTDGEVVRVFDSPFTGRTVYQQSRDGRVCVVYGHLDKLDPQVRAGFQLTCNTAFAFTDSERIGPEFSLQIMAIPDGGSWWQGQTVNLTDLLPDWMPPEPEPEE